MHAGLSQVWRTRPSFGMSRSLARTHETRWANRTRRFPVRGQHQTPETVAGAMRTRASATHRRLFEHRIVVCGDGSEVRDDVAIATKILQLLDSASTFGGQRAVVARGPRHV